VTAEPTLSHAAARALYDRIGRWQDTQRFYEDEATADLIAHADLHQAQSVFEFGVGTGRLAARLLRDHLPATAHYLGIDISATMVTSLGSASRRGGTARGSSSRTGRRASTHRTRHSIGSCPPTCSTS
jgi:SAM-dependent methyltransferase